MNTAKRLFAAVGFLILAGGFAAGDEGLWLFNLPPKAVLKAKYGFEADAAWLAHLRLSSVRFGGASGSFVSSSGLVLTNHHVGRPVIQNLSTKDRDLLKTGFMARTRDEELKCPGVELSILQEIEDVTPRVAAAERPGMTSAEAAEARERAIAGIERECLERTGLKGTVVNLFSGGMYHLYAYKVYTDVRLVFAPEFEIAKFGGDPDNFCFPRFALDICFFRVYENGRPLATPHYLKWATRDLAEGDFVVVSGHPGSTGRLLTGSQLEFLRDVQYPFLIRTYERRRALLQDYSGRGSEEARLALATLVGIENSLKAYTGYQSGLLDAGLMERKAREEAELRKAVAGRAELEKACGRAWDEIARAERAYASFFEAYQYFERGLGFNAVCFGHARNLVRLAAESRKPDGERLREFREANRDSITRGLLASVPIDDAFEIVKLTDSLAELGERLGAVPEVTKILGGRAPGDAARDSLLGTRLKDPAERKRLLEAGPEAVESSSDPMIRLARLVEARSRELRRRYERDVESVEVANGALIARALFELKGTAIAPDATFTLRFSFGVAKGYVENGARVPFATTFAGLFERSTKFGGKRPFSLPESFLARASALRPDAPLDFVATCDSIGGNSGSPVVNRAGEFVGILFDGNIQSLPARFVYSDDLNRSVMVHFRGIEEALRKVYDAGPLLEEILGTK